MKTLFYTLVTLLTLSFTTGAYADDHKKMEMLKDKKIIKSEKLTPAKAVKTQQMSVKKLGHVMEKLGSGAAVSFESGPLGVDACACSCSSAEGKVWVCDPSGCSAKEGKDCSGEFDFQSTPAEVIGVQ